ncbi:SSI family serine proteinase inhibitor [Streptomyces sp. NPDC048172]|uniref:SSI family serine proteinase inhibitor n=1 Tax=Streptomyces sp. NPDC048172 TaxID=3365505 RepID=UPI00371AA341
MNSTKPSRGRLAAPALLAAAALGTGLLAAAPATPAAASTDTAEARSVGRFLITLHEGAGTGGKVIGSARLNCLPTTGSTHPRPAQACRMMERAGGQFSMLPAQKAVCPTVHKPVTVVAKGYWKSTARLYAQIYPNTCEASARSSGVFNLSR